MNVTIGPHMIQQIRGRAKALPVYTGEDTPQNHYLIARCRWALNQEGIYD